MEQLTRVKGLTLFLNKFPKRVLIFDFDGTLFYLHLPWQEFKYSLLDLGNSIKPGWRQKNEDKKITILTNDFLKMADTKLREDFYQLSDRFEGKKLMGVEVNNNLVTFIKTNKRKYRFFIWSSNMFRTIITILKKYQIDDLFDKIISKDKVELIKPYPDGFYQIYLPKEYRRADYLFIGDSQFDKEAALRVGIDYFLLN